MRNIFQTRQFKKDLKSLKKGGKYDIVDLMSVVELLAGTGVLEPKYKDHALTGNWKNFRECHIKPDWLLIYQITQEYLKLVRTGSHSLLF